MTAIPPTPRHPDKRPGGVLAGPAMFWPFLFLGSLVMAGFALTFLLTGGFGMAINGAGKVGTPITLTLSGSDATYGIYSRGGLDTGSELDCTFSGGKAWNSISVGILDQSLTGPDGKTYVSWDKISGSLHQGEVMTCTSRSGATDLIVAQNLGRTTVLKTALAGTVAAGGFGLGLLGYRAARPKR